MCQLLKLVAFWQMHLVGVDIKLAQAEVALWDPADSDCTSAAEMNITASQMPMLRDAKVWLICMLQNPANSS